MNAFPPLAAIPVLGEATGTDWLPVAEKYAAELYGATEGPHERLPPSP
jgi:hypothetical protein